MSQAASASQFCSRCHGGMPAVNTLADKPIGGGLNHKEEAPNPKDGLVIVFSDIRDSTSLWDNHPKEMHEAMAIHDKIIRDNIEKHSGFEVKTLGDSFMMAFTSPRSALSWCLDTQKGFLDADWPEALLTHPAAKIFYDESGNLIFRGLSLRMGAHWGVPILTSRQDFIGPMVHRASRTTSKADGGQIVVSRDFLSAMKKEANSEMSSNHRSSIMATANMPDFQLHDMGDQELKGISKPLHLFLIMPNTLKGRLGLYPQRDTSFQKMWKLVIGEGG